MVVLEDKPVSLIPEDGFYTPGSYVVAVHHGEWFIGQILDKEKEPQAPKGGQYVYINLMRRLSEDRDLCKWPDKADKLNTLVEDVLFVCGAPAPCKDTSSTRSISYSLSCLENKRANHLLNKAYHTKILYSPSLFWVESHFA